MTTEDPPQSAPAWQPQDLLRYWRAGLLLAVLTIAFWSVLRGLYQRWAIDEPSGGGPLIPVAAGYLVWQLRDQLAATPATGDNRGLPVILLGMLSYWVGQWAEVFLPQGLALLLVGWGLVLWLGGPQWGRLLAFPIGFLFFMLPLPLIGPITVPVQVALTAVAGSLTRAMGVPLEIYGTQIVMEGQLITVDPGCAGMRFLLTLVAAAFFVAYLTDTTMSRRALLVAMSVPLAILINLARIELSILLGRAFGMAAAEGVSHSFTGIIVFAIGVVCLAYMTRWICAPRTGDG